MRRAVVLGTALALAAGSASAAMRAYRLDMAVSHAQATIPALGTEAEAEVGSAILTDAIRETAAALRTKSPCVTARGTLPPSDELPAMYVNGEGRFFADLTGRPDDPLSRPLGVFVPSDRSQPPELYFYARAMTPGAYETLPCPGLIFEPYELSTFGAAGPKRELVFDGLSQGAVKLTYREFHDGMARPAFSQDATYDLSAGREIGFKGARLRILKVDNVSIRYVVLKGFARE